MGTWGIGPMQGDCALDLKNDVEDVLWDEGLEAARQKCLVYAELDRKYYETSDLRAAAYLMLRLGGDVAPFIALIKEAYEYWRQRDKEDEDNEADTAADDSEWGSSHDEYVAALLDDIKFLESGGATPLQSSGLMETILTHINKAD